MGELLGGALEDDASAVVSGAGAEVDDPVGVCHDGWVVFDDDDGFAGVDPAVEGFEHVLDVGDVQACGGFVEDVDVGACAHVGGKFESLAFAARE